MLDNMQNLLNKYLAPFTVKITQNKTLNAIAMANIIQMPILIGGALFSIMANFPINAVNEFFIYIGLTPVLETFVAARNTFSPLILAFLVAYCYAKNEKVNAAVAGLFGFTVYIMMVPATITVEGEVISALSQDHFGPNGIFYAMISSVIVAKMYCFIIKKNIVFKLPDNVPPMVAQSFEPIYAGLIIFGVFLGLNYIIQLTSFETIFEILQTYIQGPIIGMGANVAALILVHTLINFFWFFGLHPSAILSLYAPIFGIIIGSNIQAFLEGDVLPYYNEFLVYLASSLGGSGGTLGLAIVMLMFAKSKKFKAIRHMSFVPSLCNINEPLMFGVPVVMNPIFFIPLMLTPILNMGLMYVLGNIITITINPFAFIGALWTMPMPITAFLVGGIPLLAIICLIIIINVVLFLPFVKLADRAAYKEEMSLEVDQNSEFGVSKKVKI